MKKIITFCLFAFAIAFNTQDLQAQNKVELNNKASLVASELTQSLKLHKDTQEEVYQAYKQYETNMSKLEKSNTANPSNTYATDKAKIKETLEAKMQSALNAEQHEKYMILTQEQPVGDTQQRGASTQSISKKTR